MPKKERVEIKAQLLALLNVIIGSVRRVSGKNRIGKEFQVDWMSARKIDGHQFNMYG